MSFLLEALLFSIKVIKTSRSRVFVSKSRIFRNTMKILKLRVLLSLQSSLAASLALRQSSTTIPRMTSSPAATIPAKMRCIVYQYGGKHRQQQQQQGVTQGLQSIIKSTPSATATRNTVLVKVHCAGLNPVDAKDVMGDKLPASWTWTRSRIVQPFLNNKIPGFDFSGTVVSSPQNDSFQPGDKVFGCMPPLQGSLAEYISDRWIKSVTCQGITRMLKPPLSHWWDSQPCRP
jgi:hypothetical protein